VLQEEKAFFSKVGVSVHYDFPLVFKDYQNLQRLHKKLSVARSIVCANLRTSKNYQLSINDNCLFDLGVLKWHDVSLSGSLESIERLLKDADTVGQTVCSVLLQKSSHDC